MTREFDPRHGQAFQGDIAFVPIPAGIAVGTGDEVQPIDGRLIIQEGEQSGHHHAIAVPSRSFRPAKVGDPVLTTRSPRLGKAFSGKRAALPSARLYRDSRAVDALRAAGILTRTDLAIGCLIVEGEPAIVAHEEHEALKLPVGAYYVGRQVESAGAEERMVRD